MRDGSASGAGDAGPRRTRSVHVSVPGGVRDEIVAELERAGLEGAERLDALGIVVGRAEPEAIERLRGLDGVVVEPGDDVQLPDPDAPVQ